MNSRDGEGARDLRKERLYPKGKSKLTTGRSRGEALMFSAELKENESRLKDLSRRMCGNLRSTNSKSACNGSARV